MKNLKTKSGASDIYNFMPDLMNFNAKTKFGNRRRLTKDQQIELSAIFKKVLNSGASIYLKPVSIDSARTNNFDYHKMNLAATATLAKNNLDTRNPMMQVALLQYLHLDAKIVFDKNDLSAISKNLSPTVAMMIAMYVKYDGDKAVFEIKFENGHLMVNDKSVM